MNFIRSILRRSDSFFFALSTIITLYGLVKFYDWLYPSAPVSIALIRDDGYSQYTVTQIARLHHNLWQSHRQIEREITYLEKEGEGGFFIKEFKWKGPKISLILGVPTEFEFSEVESLWPQKSLLLKKIEKKKALHYLTIEFSSGPFLSEPDECPDFSIKNKEIFSELAQISGVFLESWSYEDPPKNLGCSCDRQGKVCFQGTMEQRANFVTALEQKGWILGKKGRCYAKADVLVFDFELLHLCRPADSSTQSESLHRSLF